MKVKLNKIIKLISLLILLFLFYLIFIFFPLKKRYINIISNLNNFGKNTVNFFTLLKIRKNLLVENKKLKEEIIKLQEENASLLIAKQENEILRKQLNFFKDKKINFILANIVGKRKEGDIEYFILDKGSLDKIELNDPVIEGKYLIGKIIKVEKHISYFLPLTDYHFLTSIDFLSKGKKVNKKENISGLAKGNSNCLLTVEFIPSEKEVKKDDLVITSGLEEKIPRGLIIGKVKNVLKKKNSIFNKAIVETFIDLDTLRIVSVLISD